MRRPLLLLALLVLTMAGPCAAAPQHRRLRVGVAGNAPWVVRTPEKDGLDGFSVRLWDAVANRMNLQYKLVPLANIEEEIRGIVDGKLDIVVGPIGITSERARQIAFTQPYFNASLAILVWASPPTLWEHFRPFLSYAFAAVVAGLLLVVFLVGNLIWALERRHNPGIPEHWPSGIANAMWMAVVTMTTVGYGDRVPVTSLGRMTTGVWMLLATVMVSTLTASITTALTVSNLGTTSIKNAESLSGRRVAAVTGTVGETFAHSFHAVVVPAATLHDAITLLRNKRVDAVVFDEPSLRFYMMRHPNEDFALLVASFDVQSFGFALPINSTLVRDLNVILLGLQEDGTVRQLREMWFSANAAQMHDPSQLRPAESPDAAETGVLPEPTDLRPARDLPTGNASPLPSP